MNATGPSGGGIHAVAQVAVTCSDVERATAFYRDALGLPFLFAAEGMAFFQCGPTRLMLSLPSAEEFDHPTSLLYLAVTDIEQRVEEMKARGVEFRREATLTHQAPTYALWLAFLRDSEGNTLALMEEKANRFTGPDAAGGVADT
jgi:predicted enzyme related to lactoylglutathione lyase